MLVPPRLALILIVPLGWSGGSAAAQELRWQDAATLEVEGRGWHETTGPYDRLPESAKDKVSGTVWTLGQQSAGVCVRFVTDAAALQARWSVGSDALAMPHMPATGVSGLDLYARDSRGEWQFVGNGRPHVVESNEARFEFPAGTPAAPVRECLLYLPLYNRTTRLEIGVPSEARLEPPPARPPAQQRPLVVYGTSITQGGCASRPGLAYTAILGRLLDRPVINLGFSGSGTMQPPIGEVLAEIEAPAGYLIDCTWNMGDGQAVYTERIARLVEALRARHPAVPIVFVGQSHIRNEAHPTALTQRQEVAVEQLRQAGTHGLTLVPGRDLVGRDGEGTVDGVHPNDLGMERQARHLSPIVRDALAAGMRARVHIDAGAAK
jgi:hypothetical protein